MPNIAIVEDKESSVKNLEEQIALFGERKGIECSYTVFDNGLLFIENYKPIYDAVFMDIEMPLMDGMEAATRLRQVDPYVPLVFITDLKQYALKGYEVEAMDFLVKPVNYPAFSTMMERVCRRSRGREEQLVLSTAQGTYSVSVNDIVYLETSNHYVIYHTVRGDIAFFGSLSEEERRLPADRFIRCNSGYLVNLSAVRKIEEKEVFVADTCLPISRNKKKAFRQSLLKYMSFGR